MRKTLLMFMILFFSIAVNAQTPYPFSNTSAITINDDDPAGTYPSTISVSGIPSGNVVRVLVKLNNFNHEYPDDVGILLVSPNGDAVRLFTDVMGSGAFDGVSGLNLTIDDEGITTIPDNPDVDVTSGTYKPTQGTTDGSSSTHPASFPLPAPSSGYTNTMSSFNGTDSPNGTWSLYINDDTKGGAGELTGGWELIIYSFPTTAAPITVYGYVTDCLQDSPLFGVRISLLDTAGFPRHEYTDSNGYYEFELVGSGEDYVLSINPKGYTFTPLTHLFNPSDDYLYNWCGYPE